MTPTAPSGLSTIKDVQSSVSDVDVRITAIAERLTQGPEGPLLDVRRARRDRAGPRMRRGEGVLIDATITLPLAP
jgi:hypothetical protein